MKVSFFRKNSKFNLIKQSRLTGNYNEKLKSNRISPTLPHSLSTGIYPLYTSLRDSAPFSSGTIVQLRSAFFAGRGTLCNFNPGRRNSLNYFGLG